MHRPMKQSNRNSRVYLSYDVFEPRCLMSASGLLELDAAAEDSIKEALIVAGDPAANLSASPTSIIDSNRADSPFSGVVSINPRGEDGESFVCSGALISSTHVLTAAHCFDFNDNGQIDAVASASSVIFNSESGALSQGIASITLNPDFTGFNSPSVNDDIAIVELAQPAPGFAEIYEISRDAFDSPEQIVLAGFGRSGTGVDGFTTGASFTTRRVGENVASSFFVDDEGSGRREVFLFDFDGATSATNSLGDGLTLGNNREVTIGGGDSGGPSFIHNDFNNNGNIDSGELELFGINTFGRSVGTTAAPFFGSQGGGIVAASYLDFIDDVVSSSTASPQIPQSIGQVANVEIDGNFRRFNFGRNYTNPVVIAGPPSTNGADPATIRIRNVDSTGFEIRVEEFDYLNRVHAFENVSVLVVEAGTYELADGTIISADNVDTVNDRSSRIDFDNQFAGRPVVLGQVTSQNGPSTVAPRIQAVRNDGFNVRLQEQESFNDGHANETFSYLAIERGRGEAAGGLSFDAALTPRSVTDQDFEIEFGTGIGANGAFFANLQSFRGADTAALRTRSVSSDGATLFVQEGRSEDNEVFHIQERVGFLAIEAGLLTGTRISGAATAQSTEIVTSELELQQTDYSQAVSLSLVAADNEAGSSQSEFVDLSINAGAEPLVLASATTVDDAFSGNVVDVQDRIFSQSFADDGGQDQLAESVLVDFLIEAVDEAARI